MSQISVGDKVPDFSLPATGGTSWKRSDVRGEKLVLYFYPRDMTTGCTLESQQFRDLHAAFRKAKTRVVGISRDSISSHERFKAREKLPFDLLADEEEIVCRLFGVIKEKSLYGRKFMGIERSTFLVDADGVLREEWRKVKVTGHAEEVLEAARALK